jgi:hypothetical protein
MGFPSLFHCSVRLSPVKVLRDIPLLPKRPPFEIAYVRANFHQKEERRENKEEEKKK